MANCADPDQTVPLQYRPRLDYFKRSSLIRVYTICSGTSFRLFRGIIVTILHNSVLLK